MCRALKQLAAALVVIGLIFSLATIIKHELFNAPLAACGKDFRRSAEQVKCVEIIPGNSIVSALSEPLAVVILKGEAKAKNVPESPPIKILAVNSGNIDPIEGAPFMPRSAEGHRGVEKVVFGELATLRAQQVCLLVNHDVPSRQFPYVPEMNFDIREKAAALFNFVLPFLLSDRGKIHNVSEVDFIDEQIGPQFSLRDFARNLVSFACLGNGGLALSNGFKESEEAEAAKNQLPRTQDNYPERPSGGVFLGGEIALILLGFPFGLWVGYKALRPSKDASVISSVLLRGLALTGGSLLSGLCLLMLLLGLSSA